MKRWWKESLMKDPLKIFAPLVSITAVLFFISCAAPHYRTYDGPPKGNKDVALLVGIQKYASFKDEDVIVQIVSVDRKTGFRGSRWDGEYQIELLPGVHEIEVRYRGYGVYSIGSKTLTLDAEPGQVYAVKPNLAQTSKYWAPSIVNITDKFNDRP
jgi:hypothetical protein